MSEPRYPYVHVDCTAEETEELSYLLWEYGAQGVEERDASTMQKQSSSEVTLIASFEDDTSAEACVDDLRERWPARVEYVIGDAWRDAWRQYFKPTRLGTRLVVRPSWEPFQASPSDVVLTIDPGHAFGSGTHQSTRLVLTLLDAHLRGGEHVLDVGCGSGILAVGALLLGAADAVCVDVEEDAVTVTRENAEINHVGARVTASTTDVRALAQTFDVVVANIEARTLIPLAAAIGARVAPGGLLVLSGILVGQEADVLAAYVSAAPHCKPLAQPVDGEWVALAFRA